MVDIAASLCSSNLYEALFEDEVVEKNSILVVKIFPTREQNLAQNKIQRSMGRERFGYTKSSKNKKTETVLSLS